MALSVCLFAIELLSRNNICFAHTNSICALSCFHQVKPNTCVSNIPPFSPVIATYLVLKALPRLVLHAHLVLRLIMSSTTVIMVTLLLLLYKLCPNMVSSSNN